jgi:hypothetical protein
MHKQLCLVVAQCASSFSRDAASSVPSVDFAIPLAVLGEEVEAGTEEEV